MAATGYVYVKNLITDKYDVGFYNPDGVWHNSGFSYTNADSAAMKVHYLNGGNLNNTDFASLLLGFSDWSNRHV